MHVIVTGGAGFVGSHVADALIAAGDRVTVLDNLSTGRLQWIPPAAGFVECDVVQADLSSIFNDLRPDAVIHCAAQVSVSQALASPIRDLRTVHVAVPQDHVAQAMLGCQHVHLLAVHSDVYGTFNISSGQAMTICQLWRLASTVTGWSAPPRYGPHRPGDIPISVLTSDLARNQLAWAPETELATGLELTAAYCRQVQHQGRR